MGANGEKDNGLVRQSFTKAILTLWLFKAFFAYYNTDAKILTNARTATAIQIASTFEAEPFGI